MLHRHAVEYVLIGATAAIAQGYPLPTQDTDVTPARYAENYERLAAALNELQAKLRTPQGPVDFPSEPRFLASNRVKDVAQLPALRATLERIRERERRQP